MNESKKRGNLIVNPVPRTVYSLLDQGVLQKTQIEQEDQVHKYPPVKAVYEVNPKGRYCLRLGGSPYNMVKIIELSEDGTPLWFISDNIGPDLPLDLAALKRLTVYEGKRKILLE